MQLRDWLEQQPAGVITRLHHDTKLACSTIHKIKRGTMVPSYRVAKILSDATGGEVTIADLCEPSGDESRQ